MSDLLADLDQQLRKAIIFFWKQRGSQSKKQGGEELDKDRGDRTAVTGGKHLDGFRELVATLLEAAGLQRATIYWRKKTELPGWFRAEKNWDLLVVADGKLVAIVEFKSQVGSFGNNFNNRTEESLGNAADLWAAYRRRRVQTIGCRPWLGYVMMLEDAPRSNAPVRVKQPHFNVFPEFRNASYAGEVQPVAFQVGASCAFTMPLAFLCRHAKADERGSIAEINPELSFHTFCGERQLLARAHCGGQDATTGTTGSTQGGGWPGKLKTWVLCPPHFGRAWEASGRVKR